MKRLVLLVVMGSAANAWAAESALELNVSNLSLRTEADVAGKKSVVYTRGGMLSLGVVVPVNEDLGVAVRFGYGEIGDSGKLKDRVVRILPRYTLSRFGASGAFYGTAGIGGHNMSQADAKNSVYTGVAGFGVHQDVSAAFFRVGAELIYEQSLVAEDYTLSGASVKKFKLQNVEGSVNLGYKF